jgi:hypothetical protein
MNFVMKFLLSSLLTVMCYSCESKSDILERAKDLSDAPFIHSFFNGSIAIRWILPAFSIS